MQDAGKLLIGYEAQVSLYDIETETLTGTLVFENDIWSFVKAQWQWLDDSTVVCVGAYYSYVVEVSEDAFEILYVLRDYYAYDATEKVFYFLSTKIPMDKINDGVFVDKQELGRIKRYSREEIIEMARQRGTVRGRKTEQE